MDELTPIETHAGLLVKRDDLFSFGGASGGKVRTCLALAKAATDPGGLVTAGTRGSPQVEIVALVAQALGIGCRVHVPASAKPSPELKSAIAAGAEVVEHRPGYNTVIVARARNDAERLGWVNIPFGMECDMAVEMTSYQVASLIDKNFNRLVVPVGSGMSLAGILAGMVKYGLDFPVLGVSVGADPTARLQRWAPLFQWEQMCEIIPSGQPYARPVEAALGDLKLDPYYEAKCAEHLRPGDLFWVIGRRVNS
jgi:1-aminocyclopropane-1-carboxylate deaminase/D-cysteine desulfhydrase-like pyridoxal-dependent ACC family enzyme